MRAFAFVGVMYLFLLIGGFITLRIHRSLREHINDLVPDKSTQSQVTSRDDHSSTSANAGGLLPNFKFSLP